MSALRRGEALHVRLAREAGLLTEEPKLGRPPAWQEVGIHGVARPREWDAVVTADAPQLGVGELDFAVLPDGTLVVDDSLEPELEPGSLDPLASALEATLHPPYRARAVWRGGSSWGVAARRIEVAELPEDVRGDEIVLSVAGGQRSLDVDGAPSFGSVRTLERLGEARGDAFVVRAERLTDRMWQIEVTPL
jgi:hypothetical protein